MVLLRLIRSIEKTNRKITKTQLSLVFNKICIQENLLPAYTNIFISIYINILHVFNIVMIVIFCLVVLLHYKPHAVHQFKFSWY